MCKTVAAAQSAQAAQSLNLAILVLLVPPVAIMSSILFFAFRRYDASQQPTGASPSGRDPVSTRPM